MPYEPTTNFRDSNGVDLGKKLVSKDYLLSVYGSLLDTLAPGINPTPALWVWGDNGSGQLGINDITDRLTPVTTLLGGTNWKQVSVGLAGAGIKTDGSLWLWGYAGDGNLGINDSTTNRRTPVTTILGGNNWKSISSVYVNTAAIKTDGSLWVWGQGAFGQLGNNTLGQRRTPVTTILGGNNWKQVSVGYFSMAAIKTDGTLWVWGAGGNGQLGINVSGTNIYRSTPVTTILGGNDWKQVSMHQNNTAAIKTDGSLWIWGFNGHGQLGVDDLRTRSTPVTTFLGGNNWKQVSLSESSCVALKTDGTLWTWGRNTNGQLGINDDTSRSTPVTTILGGNNWKSITTIRGDAKSALKTDGSLWTWGPNGQGQLGINDTTQRLTPVTTILGGNNWKSSASSTSTLAIQSVDYI